MGFSTGWLRKGVLAALALSGSCAGGAGGSGSGSPPPPNRDTTPPEVEITSPTGAGVLSGSTTITASATDDVGVVSVQFAIDGSSFGPVLTEPPWSVGWDTIAFADGPHEITAVALDAAQNPGEATPVLVQVSNAVTDTTPPEIQITSPTGADVLSGSTTITASATDDVGVVSVQFAIDGSSFGPVLTEPPWSVGWDTNTFADGAHEITAIAWDAAQNPGEATPVLVQVSNAVNDTTPPLVRITSPSVASELAGTTTITAIATDDVGVAAVQFAIDGSSFGPELTHPPWRVVWDTSTFADGAHELTATAFDAARNSGEAPPVSVQVSNAAATPTVDFASFLGALAADSARDGAFDPQGFLYVVGGTESPGFPTTAGAYDGTFNGSHDAFVAKFAPDGALVYSTVLGGPNYDRAYAVEVDDQGIVTVAGRCGSGFPTTPGALQTTFGGDTTPIALYGRQDGFVARLSADGSTLVWSTYFGGDGPDSPRDMDMDGAGNVYLVTAVDRPNPYVTPTSFDPVFDGPFEGLVAEISADGTRRVWASYFGGAGQDGGTPSIRVAEDGTAWVLGHSRSASFPVTAGAYQTTHGGGIDLVLLNIAPGGGNLAYATYFGGAGSEFTETHGLAIGADGEAIVAATTTSENLPFVPASIPAPFQSAYGGSGGPNTGALTNYPGDGFVARFSADGSQILAFTYFGGMFGEGIEGVGLDAAGRVIVGGASYSPNLPVSADAFQSSKSSLADAFVARFSHELSTLEFGTYLGGSGEDFARALAVAPNGRTVCVGMTGSIDFPSTQDSFEPIYGGGTTDAFFLGFGF